MSLQEYTQDLNNLCNKLIQTKDLKLFIEKYGVKGIVGAGYLAIKDKDIYNKSERVIKQWIRDENLYEQFLFSADTDDQEVVKQMLFHQQTHVRTLVSECIDSHAYDIGLVLERNQQNQLYQSYLLVLIHLLADKETEVALRILRALKKMMKMENNVLFMEDDFWLQKIEEGVQAADEVVALRFMELIVAMSNANERIHNKLVSKGLLEKSILLYQTDDLLVKLNAVEIFSYFGEKDYNSKYLAEHKITQQIIAEAFNQKEELYIRKYSMLLVAKMIASSAMKLTPQLAKDTLNFVKQLIQSKLQEEISSAFEIISFICIKQEGVNLIVSDKVVLKTLLDYTSSTKVELRKKCVNVFTHILFTNSSNPKNKNTVFNLLMCFGNSQMANQIINFENQYEDLDQLQNSLKTIEQNLFSPFEDIELDYMLLLKHCFLYDEICFQYIQTPKSIEYMTSYHSKNKLIFDLKRELREALIAVCKKNSKNNKLYEVFIDNYYKALQTKSNPSQEMQYESSTL
ncbi:hypothetical protein ABPG72_012410 [Tetrahymena utriculariae]